MNKEFNHQVNASMNSDQNFELWTDYRNAIMSFIADVQGKILIVGAGNCFDLDLKKFKGCDVTLLDIDKNAMISGMDRQGVSYNTIELDITGLPISFYSDFKTAVEYDRLEAYIESLEADFSFTLDDYDYIIVMPIYTQLILPMVIDLVISKQEDIDFTLGFIGMIIQMINHKLKSHAKHLIVFSDLIEYGKSSEEGKYIWHHREHKIVLESHVGEYLNQYGHGLGSFGQADIMDNTTSITDYFVWPFDENRILLVKGEKGKL